MPLLLCIERRYSPISFFVFCSLYFCDMVKYTPQYLKKLEELLKDNGYEVRYEKGNFKSGFCILEAKKVAVINKFSTIESRIQALIEIVNMLVAQGKIEQTNKQLFLKNETTTNSEPDTQQVEESN